MKLHFIILCRRLSIDILVLLIFNNLCPVIKNYVGLIFAL